MTYFDSPPPRLFSYIKAISEGAGRLTFVLNEE